MKKIVILLTVILSYSVIFAKETPVTKVLSNIVAEQYVPKKPNLIVPLNDGEHYTQLSDDGTKIYLFSYKKNKPEELIFDAKKTKNIQVEKIQGYFFSPNEKLIMIYDNKEKIYRHSFQADYYVYIRKRNRIEALSDSIGKLRDPIFSPDSRMVVFGKGNNLHLKKLDYGTESLVTKDGVEGVIFNGVTDWLYEEEFGITRLVEWSPNSKLIIFASIDNTNVGEYSIQRFGDYPFESDKDKYPTFQKYRYPKAGTTNPTISLNVFSVYYKHIRKVPLKELDEYYIPRIKWINKTEDIAVFVLNRNQDRLKMYAVNSKSLIPSLLLDERSNTYVDYRNCDYVAFTKENKFSYASEKDGYRHLYLYDATGILDKQLTKGEFDITDFYGYDSIKEMFYYQAATTPLNRDVYRVSEKGKIDQLTDKKGFNSAQFNSAYTYFVNNYSTISQPDFYTVNSSSGKEDDVLEANTKLANTAINMPKKEFVKIKNAEGTELYTWLLKPFDFDPLQNYPMVIYQYSAPDYQEVLNKFEVGFEYYLAAKGFVVACVDTRGTGARGEEFRKCTYQHLGEKEANDLITVAQKLGSLSYIDENNVGIWGWSYGGFTTLMSMSTGSDVFKAGVAVAPITDLKLYDTAYTERYMRRPQENAAYDRSSPMVLSSKLKGNLLLIGGTADDNVQIQNIYNYADRLVEANKQFDMQIYLNRDHSLRGGNTRYHLYNRIARFFEDYLK